MIFRNVRWRPRACMVLLLASIGSIVSWGCSNLSDRFEPQTIRFMGESAGQAPRNFAAALTGGGPAPKWVVRSDASAPGGPSVLVQESTDDTSYRFPLCIYEPLMARDVSVEVKYKAISGTVDQAGGIVLRYHPENYYIARANALEDNIDLFKTVDGKREKIAEVPVKVTGNIWHTIGFSAKGSHLSVSFDGKVVVEAEDKSFSDAGKIGLWTKADSVSAFSDLRISPSH